MKNIKIKSTKELYLRPSIDHVFDNTEQLDTHFTCKIVDYIMDVIIDSTGLSLEEKAKKCYASSNEVWYLWQDDNKSVLEIIPKEAETDSKTYSFLNDLLERNEESIIALSY